MRAIFITTEAQQLREDITKLIEEMRKFIVDESDGLDGETWDALEQEIKYLDYENTLIREDCLNQNGLQYLRSKLAGSQEFFDTTKADYEQE